VAPAEHGFRRADASAGQARVDARPRRAPAGLVDGSITVEATAVSFERDGSPSLGILTGLTADGRRALANTRDPDLLQALTTEAHEGTSMRIANDGATNTVA
jgi:thiolase-like protein TLP1